MPLTAVVTKYEVEQKLKKNLAVALCRVLHPHRSGGMPVPCDLCAKGGDGLAKPFATALVAVATMTCHGDYATQPSAHESMAIGRGFRVFEALAHGEPDPDAPYEGRVEV